MKERPTIKGYEIAGRMPLFQKWGRDAIREDRKTMTRRVIIPQPFDNGFQATKNAIYDVRHPLFSTDRCPWKIGEYRVMTEPLVKNEHGWALYSDDWGNVWAEKDKTEHLIRWRWKKDTLSAMFMPYSAARTICQITGIRAERVQSMNRVDAFLEGCPKEVAGEDGDIEAAHLWFVDIWDKLNKKRGYGWDQNNWVWVVEFKRLNDYAGS